jgi:hypothetical protein
MGTSYIVRLSKMARVEASNELLQILNDLEADSFDEITTGKESVFHSRYEPLAMFAKLPRDVITRTRKEIDVKKTIFTIFFTNRKLLIAEYLPKGQKYNQDYVISDILQELEREKERYKRRKQDGTLSADVDNSKSHDNGKIQENFGRKGLVCCPNPDLSPCDFWSLKRRKKR